MTSDLPVMRMSSTYPVRFWSCMQKMTQSYPSSWERSCMIWRLRVRVWTDIRFSSSRSPALWATDTSSSTRAHSYQIYSVIFSVQRFLTCSQDHFTWLPSLTHCQLNTHTMYIIRTVYIMCTHTSMDWRCSGSFVNTTYRGRKLSSLREWQDWAICFTASCCHGNRSEGAAGAQSMQNNMQICTEINA